MLSKLGIIDTRVDVAFGILAVTIHGVTADTLADTEFVVEITYDVEMFADVWAVTVFGGEPGAEEDACGLATVLPASSEEPFHCS